jgi:hypothetical protein
VLALDYSEERSQQLPTPVNMIMAMVTPLMLTHPHPRFGIGAIPIRGITLRYPNARFRGNNLFSDECALEERIARCNFERRHGPPFTERKGAEQHFRSRAQKFAIHGTSAYCETSVPEG